MKIGRPATGAEAERVGVAMLADAVMAWAATRPVGSACPSSPLRGAGVTGVGAGVREPPWRQQQSLVSPQQLLDSIPVLQTADGPQRITAPSITTTSANEKKARTI